MMNALAAGQLITNSIRLNRVLGRGGMGSLWLADHLRLKVPVVVKFIASEFAGNPEVMARFQREAAATMAAKGAHVVQILDYGFTEQEVPFIAMEFLDGEDLSAKIDREGRISPWDFVEILRQSCKALTRAHAQGIIHRDIKPENIFLTYVDGELVVKVLDFGIAKALNTSFGLGATNTGAFLGTAYYMSPEQTMGAKTIDHRTDLWAIGVVAYYALAGVRPFDADAIGALVAQITALPLAPPSQHVPGLGAAIDQWMNKALARDPSERFASARDMATAFELAVSGAPHRRMTASSDPPFLSGATGVPMESSLSELPRPSHSAIPLDTPDPSSPEARKSGAGPNGTVPLPDVSFDDASVSYPSVPAPRAPLAVPGAVRAPTPVGSSAVNSFAQTVPGPASRRPLLLGIGSAAALLLLFGLWFALHRGADTGPGPNEAGLGEARAPSPKVAAVQAARPASEPAGASAAVAANSTTQAAPSARPAALPSAFAARGLVPTLPVPAPAPVPAQPVAPSNFNTKPASKPNPAHDRNPFDGTY